MKRIVLLAAVLMAGCVVQSYYPFCTEKSVVDLKPLVGKWTLKSSFGDDVSGKNLRPWTFNKNGILEAVDPDGIGADLGVHLFKLDNTLFLDVIPKDVVTKVNQYWLFTARATHTVCKVELTNDRLKLLPIDFNWLKDAKLDKPLPMLGKPIPGGDLPLYTATPEEWETFLRKYADSTNAFPEKLAVILVRTPAEMR
jgi:hypothetical protein